MFALFACGWNLWDIAGMVSEFNPLFFKYDINLHTARALGYCGTASELNLFQCKYSHTITRIEIVDIVGTVSELNWLQ